MKLTKDIGMILLAVYLIVDGLLGFGLNIASSIPIASAKEPVVQQVTTEAAQGHHLFLMNCAHCHGDDARSDEGPDLHDLHKSDARIHQLITSGIKGEMPSFAKKLGEPEVQQLTAYLRTLHS